MVTGNLPGGDRMKVLLISANRFSEPYPVFPLGVDHVAGAISPPHQVHVLDLNPSESNDAIGPTIRQLEPEVVGIAIRNIDNTDATRLSAFVDDYREIVREVRRASQAPIVLGGGGFTIFSEILVRELEADYGVVGEGERLALLLEALEQGADRMTTTEIPGVVRPGERVALPEPWTGMVARGLEVTRPILEPYLRRGGILNFQTHRGCPYRCVYCTYPTIEGRSLRPFPPREVGRTARELQDAGAKYLFIADAVFNVDAEHSLAVAAAMRDSGVDVPWGAYFSPGRMPEDFYRQLADTGLTHIEFGTEALSDRVLKAYRKPFSAQDVIASHRAAVAAGLHVAHFFLLGGSGEDPQTLSETLENAESLEKTVHFLFCGVRIFPGTEMHEIALREGRVRAEDDLLEPVFYISPKLDGVDLEREVQAHGKRRMNWVVGSGSETLARLQRQMYAKGHIGPLWEILIR
jgi:radical SAM superfamily enzyme YgiQ (UPF0313 family)